MDLAVTDERTLRFENAVYALRLERGWTQAELAERAGLTHRTIGNVESGAHNPNAETMLKIAEAFGVRFEQVFWVVEPAA